MKKRHLHRVAGVSLLALLAGTASALNGTWTQTTGGTYNWSDTGNWSGGTVAGGTAGNTATLTADLAGAVAINLGSAITLGALTIGDPTTAFHGYTINPNGGSFILDDTDDAVTVSKTGGAVGTVDAIHANIALSDNLTLSCAVIGSTLHLGGLISGTSKAVTITPGGAGRILALTGSNTYSGKTKLSKGILLVNSMANADGTPSALGAPANATDGTIDFGDGSTSEAYLKYVGPGHSSNRRINLFGKQNAAFDASGTGTFTLTSDMTAPEVTAKTLTLTGTGEGVMQGAIPNTDGAGAVSLSKAGAGTWALKGNNTFAGTITVNGGTLGIGHDNALSSGALTLTAGSLAAVGGARTINNAIASINSGFIFSGTEDLSLTATMSMADNKTLYNTVAPGKTLTLGAMNLAGTSGTRTTILAGTGDTTVTGVVANGAAGAGALTMAGRGTLTLKGANTFTGSTTIQGGTLLVDHSTGSLPAGSALNFGGSTTYGSGMLTLQGASGGASTQTLGALTIFNNATATGGSTIKLVGVGGGSMALTLGDSWARSGAEGTTMSGTLNIDLSSGNATLASNPPLNANGVVGGNIGMAFVTVTDATKTGFATVSDGKVVRYEGATTLGAGTGNYDDRLLHFQTKVGDAGYVASVLTLTAASPVFLGTLELDSSAGSGVLDLNSKTLQICWRGLLVTGGNGFTIQNGIVAGKEGSTGDLIVHQYATGPLTISAAAGTSSGSMTKTGPGLLVLSGASTATGSTRINQGVVRLENATGGGTGNFRIQDGGALELNGVAVGNRPVPNLSGNGVAGNGALRCVATSSYGGLVTAGFQGGRIGADSGATLTLTNGIATAAGSDVLLGGGGDIVVSTVKITGAGGVIKDGAGTAELSVANDYTGATTVNGGTLKVTGSLASGSAVTVNTNGTLTGSGTCSGTVRANSGGTVRTLTNSATGDTLTVGNLILDAGGIASFEVASGDNADTIDVTTTGSALDLTGLTIHPGAKVRLSAPNVSGTYNLIQYAGTLKGSVSNLSVDNPAPGGTYLFSAAGGYVVLQATVSASGTQVVVR